MAVNCTASVVVCIRVEEFVSNFNIMISLHV